MGVGQGEEAKRKQKNKVSHWIRFQSIGLSTKDINFFVFHWLTEKERELEDTIWLKKIRSIKSTN